MDSSTLKHYNWMSIFNPILFSLRLVGLWPTTNTYKHNSYKLYATICVSLFMFINTFFQAMNLFMVDLDLNELAASLFIAEHIVAVIKIAAFLMKLGIIKKLISQLNKDIFQPKNKNQLDKVKLDLNLWMILYRGFQGGSFGVIIFWLIRPILNETYKECELPMFAWYPFDVTIEPQYYFVYGYQSIGLLCMVTANINLDSLSVALMVYINAQCVILCDNLININSLTELIKYIRHHKELLQFSADVNVFFSNIMLAQFLACAATIALGLFKLSLVAPGTTEFYTLIMFVNMCIFQTFLFCWYGNEIEIRSSKFCEAVLSSKWVGTNLNFQKALLFFVMKTQKQIRIRAFNLFSLSLPTFMTIIRNSWSYFAVLRQLNSSQD